MSAKSIPKHFNPRPREEGDCSNVSFVGTSQHFNPRPREEGDLLRISVSELFLISIHALVKRATDLQLDAGVLLKFQSTPS